MAALLTAFYAATYFFWYYSVTTEQYTSAVFQTLLLIWLTLQWDDRPRDKLLLWLAFVTGTMLANMLTTLFMLPPLVWFILFRPTSDQNRRPALVGYLQNPGLIFKAAGLTLLPTLSYAYVYIRGMQHPEWRGQGARVSTGEWFWQFLTIQQGRDELAPGLTLHQFFTAEFPALMWQELTWVVFAGGLIGLLFLGKRRAIFLYSTLAIYAFFCWGYRFGNWFQVIIPAYPVFVIGFAAGLGRISESASQRVSEWPRSVANSEFANDESANSVIIPSAPLFPRSPARRLPVIVNSLIVALLIILLIVRFTASLPRANQHHRPADTGLEPGWAILADGPALPADVAAVFEERVALEYLSRVWGAAPGVRSVAAAEVSPGLAGKAVYITRRAAAGAPEALAGRHLQAAGVNLIALETEPRPELPSSAAPLGVIFGDTLTLAGWEPIDLIPAAEYRPETNWQIALYWQAAAPVPVDYTLSVRPLAQGQLITGENGPLIQDHQPVWGLYPTTRWQPGELVRDVYALTLPPGTQPDAVQIVVYRGTDSGFENLAQATVSISR
jgi:hypothetical protein